MNKKKTLINLGLALFSAGMDFLAKCRMERLEEENEHLHTSVDDADRRYVELRRVLNQEREEHEAVAGQLQLAREELERARTQLRELTAGA